MKLVVSDLHVSLKADEIRMIVMLRINREFMDTPLSDLKTGDTYVHVHRGVHVLDDDEDDVLVFEMRKKITSSERLIKFTYKD